MSTKTKTISILVFIILHFQTHFLSGLHPWIVYSLVGLLLCIMSHREKLPLTMKSCVYPLIGDAIFSWIGDIIDIITIMCSLFGVCVNLVIAARQMNTGLSILYSKIDPDNILIQVNFSKKYGLIIK